MRLQQKLVELRQEEAIPDQLLLLEHPPVITLGRGGDVRNLLAPAATLDAERVRFFETTRGGDITYHGPGQLVGYPIIHLGEGNRDVRKYVTKLEGVLIRTVAAFGITAERADGPEWNLDADPGRPPPPILTMLKGLDYVQAILCVASRIAVCSSSCRTFSFARCSSNCSALSCARADNCPTISAQHANTMRAIQFSVPAIENVWTGGRKKKL